tara:strand:- start:481 stop:819 length:339 start_codon:yes stop_codon:yes gene_type:complete
MHEQKSSPTVCEQCQEKELQQTKHELHKCQSANSAKDKELKKKDKKVFILMCIVVGIGAIFGKEALDSISEWLETIGSVKSGVENLTASIVPGPATLGMFALGGVTVRPRKR